MVSYVNKKGERCTYPLTQAMESSNQELVKRLKYTKDLISHMMTSNAQYINKDDSSNEQKVLKQSSAHIEEMS